MLTVQTPIPPWLDPTEDLDLIVDSVRELALRMAGVEGEPELVDTLMTRDGLAYVWHVETDGGV